MTPEQLARLTPEEREAWERCLKTTEGEWDVDYSDKTAAWHVLNSRDHTVAVACGKNNVKFIAHAKTDLPAALEKIAALQETVDELRRQSALRAATDDVLMKIIDRQAAEIAELRKEADNA